MIVRNLCAHCVVVAGFTNVGMKLNKVIATGEHCYGVARIYRIQAGTLDCSLDLQWPVVCGTPVVFGEQPWKSFDVALDNSVLFKAADEFKLSPQCDEYFLIRVLNPIAGRKLLLKNSLS